MSAFVYREKYRESSHSTHLIKKNKYDVGNPGPGLRQAGLNRLRGSQASSLDNWIYSDTCHNIFA
jgi:hypothetical protein